jgi:cytochrome P450
VLARAESAIALSTLIRRLPEIGLSAEPVRWRSNPAFRGPASLTVAF